MATCDQLELLARRLSEHSPGAFCILCGDEVDPENRETDTLALCFSRYNPYRRQKDNQMRCRTLVSRMWAHSHCVDLTRKGLLGQQALSLLYEASD